MSKHKAVSKLFILVALLLGATFFGTSQAQAAYKLTSPREYVGVGPFQTKDCKKCQVDFRILPDVEEIAISYDLVVSLGRTGRPELTHGAGTSVDFVPAPRLGKKEGLYKALRYLRSKKSIQYSFIKGNHLHATWKSSAHLNGNLVPPTTWVLTSSKFPSYTFKISSGRTERSRLSALTLFSPRVYRRLPAAIDGSRFGVSVDARIIGNLRYLGQKFNVAVSSGRNNTAVTHGAGTSVDLVPGKGGSWKQVEAAARFLRKQAAISSVIYSGAGGHLHAHWVDSYGDNYADGRLRPPARWVKVFS